MQRRNFVKVLGLSAFATSISGFELIEEKGIFSTDCTTSRDMIGPFFRNNAPLRNDLSYPEIVNEIPILVKGKVFGNDCKTPLTKVKIDIWHCDHNKEYDMDSDEFRCRGTISTDLEGCYWFKTFIPPPYAGRPKHIHYLIHEHEGYQKLATQLYFKGDKRIKKNNWIKYPWDQKRILEVYKNEDGLSAVDLDLYLSKI